MKITHTPPPPIAPSTESAEPKGPETRNDHDADDAGAAAPSVSSTPPKGQGTMVDRTV